MTRYRPRKEGRSVTLSGNGNGNGNGGNRDLAAERSYPGEGVNALERAWVRVRTHLRSEYGDAAFKNWLRSLTLLRGAGDKVVLAVPSKFWRDWIALHYGDRLVALWKAENLGFNGVEIIVSAVESRDARPRGEAPESASREPEEERAAPLPAQVNGEELRLGDVQGLCTPLDPRLTFETFVI